jgi:hypothetical protein
VGLWATTVAVGGVGRTSREIREALWIAADALSAGDRRGPAAAAGRLTAEGAPPVRAVLPSAPLSAPSPGAAPLARDDLRDQIARLETSAELGEPGRRVWSVRAGLGPIGRLARWSRVVVCAGCRLPAVGG